MIKNRNINFQTCEIFVDSYVHISLDKVCLHWATILPNNRIVWQIRTKHSNPFHAGFDHGNAYIDRMKRND